MTEFIKNLESIQEPALDVTHSEQITERRLIETATRRDDSVRTAAVATTDHQDAQAEALESLAGQLELQNTSEMLQELAVKHGFSWATLARCLGVTPTAVRKWNHGDEATPANHKNVAQLSAFVRRIQQLNPRIDNVSYWLETPVLDRTSLTRVDLYRAHAYIGLMDIATERRRPDQVLNEIFPSWHMQHVDSQDIEVIWHEDGNPSIVQRNL